MIYSYETYLEEQKILSIEEMKEIHQEIILEVGTDADAKEIYEDLLKKATRYAQIRAEWLQLSKSEKTDQDTGRTSCHDSVIIHFNILARYLKQRGKEAKWRDRLGYVEEDPYIRKRIGDFACYLVFINALNAR